ncbi:hypothetical protein LPC13_13315 [Clostridium celatum]|uniref:hypothetical protein n=1 Tax=Clostridium celatum TaxID=36834 RepID=UPI001F393870|nr:hypothetical protein [Clostridium celatum]MCE9656248.1 hypothetical protein [Clostridium celatum]
MSKTVQDKLEKKIDELKNFIAKFDSESVLGMIANDLCLVYDGKDFFNDIKLSSPYKQYMYLAGLIVSTDEKKCIDLKQEDFNKAKSMLEDISNFYALLFLPSEEEIKNDMLTKEWIEARKVSMPVFLDYFNTTILNYEEQQEKRIRRWFESYNDFFKGEYKFSVTELLEIYNFIINNIRDTLDKIHKYRDNIVESREKWLKSVENGINIKEATSLIDKNSLAKSYHNFMENVCNINRVSIKKLNDKFGEEVIRSFLNIFSITRKNREFKYYTEENPFELAPLLRNGDKYIFCPVYKQLLNAIFKFLYSELEKGTEKNKFYKKRDMEAEKEAEELLKNIFGNEGKYFSSVFETKDSHNEHDLLVLYNDILIIGEVKAAKVKEPFRNPDKAYTRIKRDFKSDKGIQKAYNQGLNLKQLILSQEKTTLYNKQGSKIIEINRDDYKKIYIFCITAENYSILATQLTLLLEKPRNEPYPWVCNLYDLDTICNAFKFKSWDSDKFLKYIDDRTELHENLFTTDELEICGYYLQEGNFDKIKNKIANKNDIIHLTPDMANIFDDIYYKQKGLDMTPHEYNISFNSIKDMLKNIDEGHKVPNIDNKKKKKKKNKNRIIKASKKNNRKKK